MDASSLLKKASYLFQLTKSKKCVFCFSNKIKDLRSSILTIYPCIGRRLSKNVVFQQPLKSASSNSQESNAGFLVSIPTGADDCNQPLPIVADNQHNSDNIAELIEKFTEFNTLSEAQLITEKRESASRCQQNTKPADCLRLAYLLSLAPGNVENVNRAQALLSQVENDNQAHANHQTLAKFLALGMKKAHTQTQQRRQERQHCAELQKKIGRTDRHRNEN